MNTSYGLIGAGRGEDATSLGYDKSMPSSKPLKKMVCGVPPVIGLYVSLRAPGLALGRCFLPMSCTSKPYCRRSTCAMLMVAVSGARMMYLMVLFPRCSATMWQNAANMRVNLESLMLKYTIHRSSCLGTRENSFSRRSCPITRGNWTEGGEGGLDIV